MLPSLVCMNGDPTPEELIIVLVPDNVLCDARGRILGCDTCSPEDADIPFDWLLDEFYGPIEPGREYLIKHPIVCPWCGASITEKTPVAYE